MNFRDTIGLSDGSVAKEKSTDYGNDGFQK